MAAAFALLADVRARLAWLVVGGIFTPSALVLHSLHAREVLTSGDARTGAFEALALGSAALALAAPPGRTDGTKLARLGLAGRVLFGLSMLVFGAQHFLYAPYLATLVPSWMPRWTFWAYFTGVAMLAAGLAILFEVRAKLAEVWLGWMFLGWVVMLHVPRSLAAGNDLDEWTSLFIALGMSGVSWSLAAKSPERERKAGLVG